MPKTTFVSPSFPTRHAGADRMAQAGRALGGLSVGGSGLLMAAVVSGALVAADQVVDTWADGNGPRAWTALAAIAFATLMLLLGPVRRLAAGVRRTARRLDATRRAALAAQQQWQTGLADAAMLAEISRSGGSAPFR
jgi:hypothetical protein